MGRKQDTFMKGMEAGARPFEEKFTKLSETTHQMGKEINSKLDGISGVIDILADDMSDMQKKELYNLNTPYDLKDDLDDDEKEIVVCSLLYLSRFTKNNEYQTKFLRSVINYTDMRTPSGDFDIACIENIENIKVQKIIMQTIMEYLYLETEDFSFLERLEDVFGYFSVNRKGIQEIKANIETIYRATGKEGLAEKYGFVPAKETSMKNIETEPAKKSYEFPCYDGSDISEACADAINIHHPYVVLKDYLVYCDSLYAPHGQIYRVHKKTGERIKIAIDIESEDGININNLCGYDKYLYFIHVSGIYKIDIEAEANMKKIKNVNFNQTEELSQDDISPQCNEKYLIYPALKKEEENKCVYCCINLESMKEDEIKLFGLKAYRLVGNMVYYVGEEDYISKLYKYNLDTGEQKTITELDYEVAGSFLQQNLFMGGQQTFQYGKYLISASQYEYEKGIYFYCLDMENDRFDSINIPDTNLYDNKAIATVSYNYIYYFSTSSVIERYNVITREKEEIIRTNHIVGSRKEGVLRKKVQFISYGHCLQVVGNYIYFTEYGGMYLGNYYRIDAKRKKEMTLRLNEN